MTTTAQAETAIRARLADPSITIPMRWGNEDSLLPDDPTAFVFLELHVERTELVSYGGGRGNNRFRNHSRLDGYVFVPRGQGTQVALNHAETIAARLRSHRDSDISCFDARVTTESVGFTPPGVQSAADNYFGALVEVSLFFDTIG